MLDHRKRLRTFVYLTLAGRPNPVRLRSRLAGSPARRQETQNRSVRSGKLFRTCGKPESLTAETLSKDKTQPRRLFAWPRGILHPCCIARSRLSRTEDQPNQARG